MGARTEGVRTEASSAPAQRACCHFARPAIGRPALVSRRLHLHAWGDEDAPRVVCLHGVTAWGGHFEQLAATLAETHRILAPDLLGHGISPWEPPWRITDHIEALESTLGDGPATWLGHSFGARLALEHAARSPGTVERLVLLDPAVTIPPHVALWAAENARPDRRYDSFREAVDRRYDESQLHGAPRALVEDELRGHLVEDEHGWRYRYAQAAVVVAHSELAIPAPAFADVRAPTLVVLGQDSYLPFDPHVDAYRSALGDLLEVTSVAGGHTVLWDAFDETAAAVRRFLAS